MAIDEKHLTQCIAAAVHWLIWKAVFKTKISQNKVAEKFLVQPKKLHIAIMGRKYDPGRKPTKKEKTEQAAAMVTPSKPKVAKQDTAQEDTTQLSEDTTTIDIDLDSLPDPFAPKETTPKTSGTKEDQSAEISRKKWTQCRSSFQMMTMMPHQKASAPKTQLEFQKHHTTTQRNLLQRNHPHGHAANNSPLISLYPKLLSILFPKLNFSLFYP